MSWSDHKLKRARRPVGRLSALVLVPAMLIGTLVGGCGGGGFQPLYGPTMSGVALDKRMAEVDVLQVPGRVGQRIRNELIFQTTGGADPVPHAYRLEIAIRESILSTLVRSTGDSAGQIYSLDAHFRLISIKDKKVLVQGVSHARASFERYDSIFSNVRAREDAENRAARTAASEIKMRIAAFLSGNT
ncbi:MAG TPA: LPS assembly lipoprotein LptE [Hyphomicrobiaceae bacterium]|nr:LPS assembly lipoprotein LptE [Hyphomicrobiaceae bacterium]